MKAIRQRIYMIAVIKDAAARTTGYRVIDNATKKVHSLSIQQLRVDLPNKTVLCKLGNQVYIIENLHSHKKDTGEVVVHGGISGQISKYPVINEKGQLITASKLSTTVRITLLASYKDLYKFSDYAGNLSYLSAMAVYQGVNRGKYALTNAKLVTKGNTIFVSLLYGSLVKEEDIHARKIAAQPTVPIIQGAQPAGQIKVAEALPDKMAVKESPDVSQINRDELVEAINYVRDKMESKGIEVEDLDCIGISLMYHKVYTCRELKAANTFNKVNDTALMLLKKNLHFSDFVSSMDNVLFTP